MSVGKQRDSGRALLPPTTSTRMTGGEGDGWDAGGDGGRQIKEYRRQV